MTKDTKFKIFKRADKKVKDYMRQYPDAYAPPYEVAISENILSGSEKRVYIPAIKKIMHIFKEAITEACQESAV